MAIILFIIFFVMIVASILIIDNDLSYSLVGTTFAQSGNVTSPLNKTQEWISQKDM